ncbi:MAG TPA: arginase family protein [Candidatus Limnocylindria bacterium]|nr:arginase family protein [Candidatus Limnocylindria bacterium]
MAARPLHLFEAGVVTETRFAGMANAPGALAEQFVRRLGPEKHVRVPFNPRDRWVTAAREACRTLGDAIASSMRAGATGAILGGECTLVAGSLAGALSVEPDLRLVYFDAHGDFNTLATTPSHYVGGMCLAHVCGRSIAPLLWPGSRKIAEERVALVGGRALDPGERGNLERSHVTRIKFDADHADASEIVAFARKRKIWLHVDLDVLDPSECDAVVFPAPGGVTVATLADAIASLAAVADVRGFELCGYDPRQDAARRMPEVIAALFEPLHARVLTG